jgi:alpha-methylacyl-CoA racemase
VDGPLTGLKIVELAGIGPAPFACMLLADLGADVIRIERDSGGDELRGTSEVLRRSRPVIQLDLKNERARELVLELCVNADALIEGFRPGVTERLGLGPDVVLERNPKLVYGRMTGYGQTGPLSTRVGHDINYIAIAGALWCIGRSGDGPVPPLNLVGDFGGGALYMAFGIVSAILSAQRSGEGQVVDVAMVDGAASMMAMTHSLANAGEWIEERGANLLDSGAPFYDVYETHDGQYMAVGALEARFYDELLKGLGVEPGRLPDQMDRTQWPHVRAIFSEIFMTKTRDEWTAVFDEYDACVTPVLSPREATKHPYNTARNVFTTEGDVQPQPAPRFSRTPGSIKVVSEDSEAAARDGLGRWGIDSKRFDSLQSMGVLK